MLTENDLLRYLSQHTSLPKAAKDYIISCFNNEPSRMVGEHAKRNTVSWIPSAKLNGRVFSTESRGAEYAFHTLAQYDDNVLWYSDQPEPICVTRTIKNGSRRRGSYTPDAISLTKNGPFIIEVKTAEEVDKLLEKKPEDWKKADEGTIQFKPAIEAFAGIGLRHVVNVFRQEDLYFVANVEQILWARETSELSGSCQKSIEQELEKYFVLSLEELKKNLELDSYAPIIRAIDNGIVVADLKHQLITKPESCYVSKTLALLEEGKALRNSKKVFLPEHSLSQSLSRVPTLKSAEEALFRLSEIQSGRSNRNIRRWKARIEEGEKNNLSPFQSLISQHFKCGNNSRKLNSLVKNFLCKFIDETYIQNQGLSPYRGYKQYQYKALSTHPDYEPVSRTTFKRYCNKVLPEKFGAARGGRRLQNALALPVNPVQRNLKAQTAWQAAAIDHYLVDLYLIFFNRSDTPFVERPWLTVMIDLYSDKVIAFSISFLPPSRKSDAKVIRDCVRRHSLLPREIVVDRGSDFKSVYFASLLAHYSVTLSQRPPGHSRSGGEVEGFFGEFKKQWLSQCIGNLADFKESRSVDGKMHPKKLAILTPEDFYRELSSFCNWRDNKCRGIKPHTSQDSFENSFKDFPHVARKVKYDSEFIVVTAVESKDFTCCLQKGICTFGQWYSAPELQLLLGKPKKQHVRIDPENPNVIYVRIKDRWFPFFSSEINTYAAKSAEHQIAEGLIKHETFSLKSKIKESDNLLLAGLAEQMDEFRKNTNSTPVLEILASKENDSSSLIFSKLKESNIRPINIQQWSN